MNNYHSLIKLAVIAVIFLMVGRSFIVKGTTTCFGEDSTSSTSCGAFGRCIGNDTCSCDPNVAIG